MSREFEIHSSNFKHNMAAWCEEKSEYVIIGLARIVDLVKSQKDLPPEFQEELQSFLSPILWDVTKIFAFSCGAEWSTADSGLIFDNGYAGYEELAVKYGLLDETSESKRMREISLKKRELSLFLNKFFELLEGDKSPNRTLIHELLASCKIKHVMITQLSNLIEQVTMGELTWEKFIPSAKSLLNELAKELNVPQKQ